MRTFCAAVSRVNGGNGGRLVGLALMRFSGVGLNSIDDKKSGAGAREIAMALGIVCDLETHAGREREFAAVFELDFEFTLDAEKHVPFRTPVARQITRRIFHHAHAHAAALDGPPVR